MATSYLVLIAVNEISQPRSFSGTYFIQSAIYQCNGTPDFYESHLNFQTIVPYTV